MSPVAPRLMVLVLIGLTSQPASAEQPPLPVLRDAAARSNLLVGAAVNSHAWKNREANPDYFRLLGSQFNIITAENAMKFGSLSHAPGEYDWALADAMFDFAEKHGMKVRFHAGLWHQQIPKWLDEQTLSNEQIKAHARRHIETVGQRYGKRMRYWDVVNEPIDPGKPDGLRDTIWKRAIGEDYLAQVYRWAHEAAPDVKLVINDYGIIGGGRKADTLYRVVKQLLDDGVPVHAVGFQTHWLGKAHPTADRITANLQRFADLGLEVHVTEMDVATTPLEGDRQAKLAEQARRYRLLLDACSKVDTFTVFQTWGFADQYTWVRNFKKWPNDEPLLFDKDYQPKPAFWAVHEALLQRAAKTE